MANIAAAIVIELRFVSCRDPKECHLPQIRAIALQLLTALEYVHAKGYCHTDCKPDNVLTVVRRDGTLQIKLIDFGSAIREADPHPPLIGTCQYRSPEAILHAGWSFPTDVFSAGCVLAELFARRPLFPLCPDDAHLRLMQRCTGQPLPTALVRRAWARRSQYNAALLAVDGAGSPRVVCSPAAAAAAGAELVPTLEALVPERALRGLMAAMLDLDPSKRATAAQVSFISLEGQKI